MSGAPWGERLPRIVEAPPGPRSRAWAARLARVESPNVTFLSDRFPVFWEAARGANVRDVDGNEYVDLTAAFGVANVGHAHPEVVRAVETQAQRLVHGMGDVHPPAVKVELLEALTRVTPEGVGVSVLANSGSEAVEIALKTAALATGRPRVLAFTGAYHGLSYGALPVSGRADFRAPFTAQLRENAVFVPFPRHGGSDLEDTVASMTEGLAGVGAVLVEPVQARGGEVVPPPGFLRRMRTFCDDHDLLLVVDEIYTGFGRTGRWFACDHEGVVPDLLLVGKALTSALPCAACVGRPEVMSAWPPSTGEALHTSTFLGNPLACAAALASIRILEREGLVERARVLGERARRRLSEALAGTPGVCEVRGVGMMIGVELGPGEAGEVMLECLSEGVLVLPSGPEGEVVSVTPPLVITETQLDAALDVVIAAMRRRAGVAPSRPPNRAP